MSSKLGFKKNIFYHIETNVKLLSWFLIATIEAHGGDFDVPMVKRDEAVNDCERSAAMVALRACRKYCSQNYRKFPGKMIIEIKI